VSTSQTVAADLPQPFQGSAAPGIVDGRPALREWIAENLHLTTFEAESAWRCAEIADDAGLKYHVRRMAGHARQVVESTNGLKSVNDQSAESEAA
jgi:hypothetical protein